MFLIVFTLISGDNLFYLCIFLSWRWGTVTYCNLYGWLLIFFENQHFSTWEIFEHSSSERFPLPQTL